MWCRQQCQAPCLAVGAWKRLAIASQVDCLQTTHMTMDGTREISLQDKKDLEKFLKFFAFKTVQVIVQGRLGEKISTCSTAASSGSDWFNLAIKDIPEVSQEAKKVLSTRIPAVGFPMCVEISLKTCEGDSMGLEVWSLEVHEKCDWDVKVSHTVYNRLSLLLKSLLSVTRVTPAYKLSRKQGPDFVILYRVYLGEVQMACLGEGFQSMRVGAVGTPMGTVILGCAYRTNLAFMSSRRSGGSRTTVGGVCCFERTKPSDPSPQPCTSRFEIK
uniref:autophagy-related protein 13 isoform X1 n=2 Tax=Myxine glutinosa TaxID=7769 RepID=UPI00358FC53A